MLLQRLRVRELLNFAAADLVPHPGLNLLLGHNGAGKTNLAEAVFLLNAGQSFRPFRQLAQLVRLGGERASVEGEISTRTGAVTLTLTVAATGAKTLLRDGKKATQADFLRAWLAVLFTPDDALLVNGAPQVRRRYLDMWLARREAGYYEALRRYWQAVEQRNRLLADVRNPRRSAALPDWDAQVAQHGAVLLDARRRGLALLLPQAQALYRALHGGAELTAAYRAGIPLAGADSVAALQAVLQAALVEARPRELQRQQTLVGPHRDDLELRLDGQGARQYGSGAERYLLALALRLAEYADLRAVAGEAPVLILDEPFNPLDGERRERVLAALRGTGQCFLTTALPPAALPEGTKVFRLTRGTLDAAA